jgi:hypothetical protein
MDGGSLVKPFAVRLWMCKTWGVLWVWRRDEIARACVNSGLRMCGCAERGADVPREG